MVVQEGVRDLTLQLVDGWFPLGHSVEGSHVRAEKFMKLRV